MFDVGAESYKFLYVGGQTTPVSPGVKLGFLWAGLAGTEPPRAIVTTVPGGQPMPQQRGWEGLPGADWAFLHSCCSLILPGAWALEEVEPIDSSLTPFSVLSSGANWWAKRGWSGPWKQLDCSGSLLFACHPELAPLISGPPQRMQGSCLSCSALSRASEVITTTALGVPRLPQPALSETLSGHC